jgi:hypothetical protein
MHGFNTKATESGMLEYMKKLEWVIELERQHYRSSTMKNRKTSKTKN